MIAILVAAALTAVVSPGQAQEPQDLTTLSLEELTKLPPRSVFDRLEVPEQGYRRAGVGLDYHR